MSPPRETDFSPLRRLLRWRQRSLSLMGISYLTNCRLSSLTPLDPVRARTIAVGGALQRAPLADLEARLSETGLSAVQAADLRNFAHGRHVGLERNAAETTVVFLSDATSLELTRRTADLLPDHIDVRHLVSTQQFPASVIELVAQSMALTAANGRAVEVDPAKPGVAAYGRKLYRLTAGRSLTAPQADPIERKLAAASLNRSYRSVVERSLDHWLKELSNTRFKAIALDYDGTCCATNQRYYPPDRKVANMLGDLASAGLMVAFASGRGRSLHEHARTFIPEQCWSTTLVGLYNGSVILTLADEVGGFTEPVESLAEAEHRIKLQGSHLGLSVERRTTQLTVTSRDSLSGKVLLPIMRSILKQPPDLGVRAVASGHSVDIIEAQTTKAAIIDRLMQETGGEVLAIGDQGHCDGNDFELLARTNWSLSVDRVSPDLSRCWNLADAPALGPEVLLRYLAKLYNTTNGWRMRWRAQR